MEENLKIKIHDVLFSIINSYSQVFFSKDKILAILLVVISFFDFGAGIGGLIAVIIANLMAYYLGYNAYLLKSGLYGFNSLLVGLGIGLVYQPSIELYILIAIAAVSTFFLTIVFQGVLGKYGLPFLSVPFLLSIWMVSLAGGQLTALNISERGIYTYNELYALGGGSLINLYDWLEHFISSSFLRTYFYSLGAIFFQKGLLAGIIISLGLLIYSRITFVLSFLGFAVAYLFYSFIGIGFDTLGYTFIGFNYILTAIALGGYYLIPGKVSYLWIILLLPAVVLITISTQQIFLLLNISPYSLPFNIVVLMFLYALKLREKRPNKLIETPVQLGNPEKNLYLQSGNLKRFPTSFPVSTSLPFYGEWKVSQAQNGEITHQGAWRHAWDFIITDRNDKQYKNKGDYPEDYFCFGKAIVAPYEGKIIEVIDSIPDNIIGDINTKNNWGNTVIIEHSPSIYSQLSHLKYHSIAVKEGDFVKQGQLLGKCGNSGRSPYPHLHFQFQSTPFIGSPTLEYPIGNFLLKTEKIALKTFSFPEKDQHIINPTINDLLSKALHFIPGQRINGSFRIESIEQKELKYKSDFQWEVKTDIYNSTYISSEVDKSLAYLYNDEKLHYFTNFTGKKESPLYWFFLALFKVPLGFLPESTIQDQVPANLLFTGPIQLLQDFIAPIYLFLKVDYNLKIKDAGDILSLGNIEMHSTIRKKVADKEVTEYNFNINIEQDGSFDIKINYKDLKIKLLCGNAI
jgi:urea transporter